MIHFKKMEWWKNKREVNFGHAFVGFCGNGDIYLTFDVREGAGIPVPVFSPICKVGSKNGHTEKAYRLYREMYTVLENYEIEEITECKYKELNNINKFLNFSYKTIV